MQNINLINSLSGLLILTSLLVIEARNMRRSAILYGIQSLVLVVHLPGTGNYDARRATLSLGGERVCDQGFACPLHPCQRGKGHRRTYGE